jgi:hypothetical protein
MLHPTTFVSTVMAHLIENILDRSVFLLCNCILVIHCCFQNKNLYQNY